MIWTAGFAADGSLVTAANDFTVTWWRLLADGSARKERAINANPEGKYICGSLSRDGTLGVAGTRSGAVEVLDLSGAAPGGAPPVARLEARQAEVYGTELSPDARWIAAGYRDNWAALWRRGPGGEPSSWELVTRTDLGVRVRGFSFSPDGGLVAMSCPDHSQVHLHELATGRSLALPPAREPVFVTAFHPRQPLLACALYRGTIELWRLERTGGGLAASPWGTLEGHGGAAEALCFSPDASLMLSGGGDRTVRIWDLIETPRGGIGLLRATLRGFEGGLLAIGFSPDGRTLLTSEQGPRGARGVVRLWRTATIEEVAARRRPGPGR
jgi:WD40 repeat protein